jgi:acyl dehydratase
MATVTFDELNAMTGTVVGVSEWLTVDQDMINKFADATGDHQFIHVDEEKAKLTPFGGTIAHGFLSLSIMPVLTAMTDMPRLDGIKMGVNYGGNKTRFLAPVRSGKRVRGHFKLLEIEEKRPGQWQQTVEYTLEIEGEDKPALIAEWISPDAVPHHRHQPARLGQVCRRVAARPGAAADARARTDDLSHRRADRRGLRMGYALCALRRAL